MLLSYRWLTRVLGTEIPLDELLSILTMAGLEVENVLDLGIGSGKVVVGRILTKEQHPNADKLSLCDVQAGEGEPLRIVCGASNMKPGDLVPLALEGAQLPGGFNIKKSKIRGESSYGMMCSGRELGFGDDHEGLLILPPADDPNSIYVEGEPFDAIIEIKVTPNRPDCLSVYGIARDVAALKNLPPIIFPVDETIPAPGSVHDEPAPVSLLVQAPEACPRYLGRVIRGVKIAPSHLWLRRQVESAGLRSLNNVVDITNLVLLELGQPLHAFDLSKISGDSIVIRHAFENERAATLDGQEVELKPTDLLIADAEKPIALAGIMGCGNSEITDATTDIFLECAYFDPAVIRRTSKRIGKSTDSSYRFERGIDWSAMEIALSRAVSLILSTAGGTSDGSVQFIQGPEPAPPIRMAVQRVNARLGVTLRPDEIVDGLRRLGFSVHPLNENEFNVQPPAHRPDVSGEADLIEEVARIVGYDKIPARLPAITSRPALRNADDELAYRIRRILTGHGFLEACNYSFEAEDASRRAGLADVPQVRLSNPLSAEFAVMRTSMLPSILSTAAYNHNRGQLNLRIFEIGKIYSPAADNAVREEWAFAALMSGNIFADGWRNDERQADFYDARAIAESLLASLHINKITATAVQADPDASIGHGEAAALHPGKSAILEVEGKGLLLIGNLHPKVAAELDLKRDAVIILGSFPALTSLLSRRPRVSEVPIFPALTRDLALVADKSVAAADIEAAIVKRAQDQLSNISLFDVYDGEKMPAGKRSLAYSLSFCAQDRTLTDEEVNTTIEKILGDLNAKLGVTIRA